jgi:hypothetical protein
MQCIDRSYALQTMGVKSLWDLGLQLFRDSLETNAEVLNKLILALLSAVDAERRGVGADKEVLRRLLKMLTSLGLYHDRFEIPFLRVSEINNQRNITIVIVLIRGILRSRSSFLLVYTFVPGFNALLSC